MTILKSAFKKKKESTYKRIGIALAPSAAFTVVPNYTHPKTKSLKAKNIRKYAAITSAIAGAIALPRVMNKLSYSDSDSFDSSSYCSLDKESMVRNPSAGFQNISSSSKSPKIEPILKTDSSYNGNNLKEPCEKLSEHNILQQTIESDIALQESVYDDYELKDTALIQTVEEPESLLSTKNEDTFIYLLQKIVEKNLKNKKINFYSGKFLQMFYICSV